LRMVTTFL